jgi:hypothetical protein
VLIHGDRVFQRFKSLKYHRRTQSVAQKLYIVRGKGGLLLLQGVIMAVDILNGP